MKTVKFTKDFATKKEGDLFTCDTSLASLLVNREEVAEYYEEEAKPKRTKKAE